MNVFKGTALYGAAAWCLIVALGLPLPAYADTYNFHFAKPKGEAAVEPEAEEPKAETKVEPKAESTEKSQTVNANATPGSPIVIHNNNQISMPPSLTAPTAVASEGPKLTDSTSVSSAVVAMEEGPSAWRLGLTTTLGKDMGRDTYELMSPVSDAAFGLSLAYSFSRTVALNTYASFGEYYGDHKLYAGTELEVLPFRWQLAKWDPIAFGFIFGGSTLAAAPGNVGSLHAGLRLNINPIKEIGITGALRGNAAYVGGEFGIIVRL